MSRGRRGGTSSPSRRCLPCSSTLLFLSVSLNIRLDAVVCATAAGRGSSSGGSKGRTQLVSVSAPWPTSCLSPLAEASEFVAEGGSGLFWDYVEALGEAPHRVFSLPSCSPHNGHRVARGAAPSREEDRDDSEALTAVAAAAEQQQQQQQQQGNPVVVDEDAKGAVAAAVTAAGKGFGDGGRSSAGRDTGADAARAPGVGLDALSLRLLEIALSARAHAPAIESHRALAAPTRSTCLGAEALAPSSRGSLSSPGAWVVLLPSGNVVCSPEDLDLSLLSSQSSSSSGSGTCSTEGGGVGGGGEGGVQACVAPHDTTLTHDGDGNDGVGVGVTQSPERGVSFEGAFAFDHVYSGKTRRFGGGDGEQGDEDGEGGGADGSESSSIPPSPLAAGATTAVLYGVVGSPAMMGFHGVLKAAAEAGKVRYAFRHALPYGDVDEDSADGGGGGNVAETTTLLQGYGVVLDVKNMEYQSFDSSDRAGEAGDGDDEGPAAAAADALSIVEGEEVGGVVFSTLAARRPELRRELGILRQALIVEEQSGGGDGGTEELKVWNMADLGIQALQSVAAAENPILRLEELSQNFPSHASALSALKVQPGTREEVQAAGYLFSTQLGLRPGSLYVNGKMLDLEGPTFNAFQVLSTLRAEASIVAELRQIGAPQGALSGDRVRSLLTASGPLADPDNNSGGGGGGGGGMGGPPSRAGGWRVDIVGPKPPSSKDKKGALPSPSSDPASPAPPIVWLNDLETDEAYMSWSPSLQQLAYAGFQLPRVRKNLCNVVIVADPTTPTGAETLQLLQMIVEQGLPVRVGLLLVSEKDLGETDADDEEGGGGGPTEDSGAGGDGNDEEDISRSAQPREIAELFSRLSEHEGSRTVKSFAGLVGAAALQGGGSFSRRALAEMFRTVTTRGPLSESPASAEPWTKEGALWRAGGGDGAGQPLPGSSAMARLCLSKGLSAQSWSVNGLIMGSLSEMRKSLMQAVMQELMLIGQLAGQGLVTDKTRDVYSRVLKHSGDEIRPRVHPAYTETLAEAAVSDLSSPEAADLFVGRGRITDSEGNGGGGGKGMDWLHPSGTGDDAKGVSVVAVVDPLSRNGLATLEEALSFLVSGGGQDAASGGGDDDGTKNAVDGAVTDDSDDAAALPDEVAGDTVLPRSGMRLAVVFNARPEGKGGGAVAGGDGKLGGRWLPAVFEAVGSRSPDKAPKFLLSVTRAAISFGPGDGANASDVVENLAREAGLSPSLQTAAVKAAGAAAAAGTAAAAAADEALTAVVAGRARLVRSVAGLEKGESCALVNGRRAIPAREGRPLTAADLAIATDAADDLGEFLKELALGWDWGSWPEGSPESADPDLVGAQLQSSVISQLASFLLRYHQERRETIPDPDTLTEALAEITTAAAKRSTRYGSGNPTNKKTSSGDGSGFVSILHLESDGRLRQTGGNSGGGVGGGDGREGGAPWVEDVAVELVAVLDPLSVAAQRASTLLSLAQDVLRLPVTVLLLPSLEVSELPLKNFYRLVLGPASDSVARFDRLPTRDILTQRLDTPERWNVQASAALQDLDNLRCDDAAGCGDNGTYTTSAEYTLKGLLITGRCYDVTSGTPSPPQGLQFVLRAPSRTPPSSSSFSSSSMVVADTVVMENLGYFQLQAAPGVWELALADGRASDVYEIIGDRDGGAGERGAGVSSGAAHSAAFEVERRLRRELGDREAVSPATESQAIAVRNFYSRYEPVLVHKRPGMEGVGLLESDEEAVPRSGTAGPRSPARRRSAAAADGKGEGNGDGEPSLAESVWSGVSAAAQSVRGLVGLGGSAGDEDGEGQETAGLSSSTTDEEGVGGVVELASGGDAAGKGGEEAERLHVFSLATGHLYERFLKVMMMSVVKRASMPVTFWLLENFLSSSFKDSAQSLAEEFGFRVEFVTYKWPEWLRRQSEKQRIIWGYKILFLDVLFPLNVDKVIYVDADQVVRADLKELWDLDLQGAPYGYTPFCSSREETLGYQFWRGGFWQTHLMGRPYHISALYVVDLKTFRRMAVGDTLRSIYNSLSQDPNSLSNLDQDLPNYAQVQVPIFSLPQEWLWCESWCSDASKVEAKTIDLCNNPQHKEPKLDMAKRVISGPLFEESWIELDAEVRASEEALSS